MVDSRILMVGCGTLGQRIGLALAEQHHVFGLRRNASRVPLPLTPVQADLNAPEQLAAQLPQANVVVICLTPDQYDTNGYERTFVEGLNNLLQILESTPQPPSRVFFVSSTAVYGQSEGQWVDEASATEPTRYNGQILVRAEQRLAQSPLATTVVRLSGIYGRGRDSMLSKIIDGGVAPNPDSGYTNRIHEDDAVGSICHLVNRALREQALDARYLASDCEPARLGDIVNWVRETVNCAPVKPDAQQDSRAGSKRCDSSRLREAGYEFLFPTFREGYGSMLACYA